MLDLVLHSLEGRRPKHRVRAFARRNPINTAHVSLLFDVVGSESVVWPASATEGLRPNDLRADELWKATCFECFVARPGDKAYTEWNFSPSGQWQAYDFQDYRRGRSDAKVESPALSFIQLRRFEVDFELPTKFQSSAIELSLTTVILEKGDSAAFYWALQHDADKPDFHARSSFSFLLER
jgi:hypothetical protein